MIPREQVTGIVLAGGLGRRMGGVDKGLVMLDGRPMVARVLERLRPQVADVLINANQNAERYAEFGYPVVRDAVGGFAGPLAGLHAGLAQLRHEYAATVPCDSPFLPADLIARLGAGLSARVGAQLAVAKTFDQPHPVCAVVDQVLEGQPHAFADLRKCGEVEHGVPRAIGEDSI